MTSQVLKLKVKASRAYRELNSAARYTQYCDKIDKRGIVDIIAVEDCERILQQLKEIHEQQMEL
jgi:hypothetical protein